jgi:hypothetical protein
MAEAEAEESAAAFRSKAHATLRQNYITADGEAAAARRSAAQTAARRQAAEAAIADAAALDAALESFTATARTDFNRDLPVCSDILLSCASSFSDFCITVQTAGQPHRNCIHCIIVLDVSGSMEGSATLKPSVSQGSEDHTDFSRLDLAKHSSKVIVEVMEDGDSVTLISFSGSAQVKLDKTYMTSTGK